MKREEMEENHHKGVLGWSFSIVGVIFSIVFPFAGLLFGIIGLVISTKEMKKARNEWTRSAKILAIFAIIASVLIFILNIISARYILSNPALLGQLQGLQ